MSSLPQPKAPTSLVKVTRWSLLTLGIIYGFKRNGYLFKKETARRAKEEEERPAREAALKAEKDRKNYEEMAYLGKEVGIPEKGGSQGGGKFASDCGCKY